MFNCFTDTQIDVLTAAGLMAVYCDRVGAGFQGIDCLPVQVVQGIVRRVAGKLRDAFAIEVNNSIFIVMNTQMKITRWLCFKVDRSSYPDIR